MVKYVYDAWGNCLTTVHDINATGIANLNPFRYRGYYYDVETKLYFLQTRYYDPEIGRFITIDDISYLDPDSINGLNLYAYFGSNPVMRIDPAGQLFSLILFGVLAGIAGGGVFNIAKQLWNNGGRLSEVNWGSVLNSMIVGGALGFSLAMGVGFLGPVLAGVASASGWTVGAFAISTAVSFGAGAIGYVAEEIWNHRSPSFSRAMMNGGFVALEGANNFLFGGIVGSVGSIGKKGRFLFSKEWWKKFLFAQEFTFPFRLLIDLLRNNL